MNLRFRSGSTYELSFVKRGYQTTKKRFAVTRRTKSLSVSLRKKPTGKKSFFQRLFGR